MANAMYVFIKLNPAPNKYKTGPNKMDLVVAILKCAKSTSGFNTKVFFKILKRIKVKPKAASDRIKPKVASAIGLFK